MEGPSEQINCVNWLSYSWGSFLTASLYWSKHVCVFVCAFWGVVSCADCGCDMLQEECKGFLVLAEWNFSEIVPIIHKKCCHSVSQSTNLNTTKHMLNADKLVSLHKLGGAAVQGTWLVSYCAQTTKSKSIDIRSWLLHCSVSIWMAEAADIGLSEFMW